MAKSMTAGKRENEKKRLAKREEKLKVSSINSIYPLVSDSRTL